jgi:hypothetical protein
MKRVSPRILSLLLLTSLVFAEGPRTAKVLNVKAYNRGRIAYWEGRVPIYDGYPFYDLTLALGKKTYLVRYESMTGYFPSSWKAGSEVKVRAQGKGRFYLTNGSEEVSVETVRGVAADCVLPSSPPVVASAGPQAPCE